MKLGLIIIFNNNHNDIYKKELIDQLRLVNDLEICMVDNESKDSTLEDLKEIRENCSNVSVVEIKKQITQEASKRAGARFMFNNFNIRYLGYLDVNTLKDNQFNFNEIMKLICNDVEAIIEYDKDLKRKYLIKPTLFKSVFSVLDFINQKYRDDLNSSVDLLIV